MRVGGWGVYVVYSMGGLQLRQFSKKVLHFKITITSDFALILLRSHSINMKVRVV